MLYTQQTLVISLGQNLKLTQCLTFSELCCVPKYGQYYAVLWWKFRLNPTSQNSLRTKSMQTSCQSNKTHMSQFLSPPTSCTQIPNLFRIEQVFSKACIKLLNEPIFLQCVYEQKHPSFTKLATIIGAHFNLLHMVTSQKCHQVLPSCTWSMVSLSNLPSPSLNPSSSSSSVSTCFVFPPYLQGSFDLFLGLLYYSRWELGGVRGCLGVCQIVQVSWRWGSMPCTFEPLVHGFKAPYAYKNHHTMDTYGF